MKTLISLSLLALTSHAFSLFIDLNCTNDDGDYFAYYHNVSLGEVTSIFQQDMNVIKIVRGETHQNEEQEAIAYIRYDNDITPQSQVNSFSLEVTPTEKLKNKKRNFYKKQHISQIEITHFVPVNPSGNTEYPFKEKKDFTVKLTRVMESKKEGSEKLKPYWGLVFTSFEESGDFSLPLENKFKFQQCNILYSEQEVTNR